jgi:hypothetical protein
MHAPILSHRSFGHVQHSHVHHRSFLRILQAHLRGWSRNENIVATFSLAFIVTTVLILLSRSM